MKLHEHIRALRRERGMTQEQLAEAMNVSAAAVSKWENGVSRSQRYHTTTPLAFAR